MDNTMNYFIQVSPDGKSGFVWQIEGCKAHRYDTGNGLPIREVSPGKNIVEALRKEFSYTKFYELNLRPVEYFPRMARPGSSHPSDGPGYNPASDRDLVATSRGQLNALREQLERICRVVHPTNETFGTFGHEIRNLLILACTEVEAHWKGVLKANRHQADSTNNYVKLSEAMKLREYAISFPYYPWLRPIKPFDGWGLGTSPTKDLEWYDAYNAVKHDRETEFGKAKLQHAFSAVAGCVVMICAQFGWAFALRDVESISSFFELDQFPQWQPSNVYTPARSGMASSWVPKHYRF